METVYVRDDDNLFKIGKVTGFKDPYIDVYIFDTKKNKKFSLNNTDDYKLVDDEKFSIIKDFPEYFDRRISQTEIDENQFINKKCNDLVSLDELNNNEYLNEDENENILLITKRKITNNGEEENAFFIDCFKRSYIRDILNDNTNCRLMCELYNSETGFKLTQQILFVRGFANPKYMFYKISTTFGSYYIAKNQLEQILKLGNRIFYINPNVVFNIPRTSSLDVLLGGSAISSDHCQPGTDINVYSLEVCEGERCLREIFIPRYDEENFGLDLLTFENNYDVSLPPGTFSSPSGTFTDRQLQDLSMLPMRRSSGLDYISISRDALENADLSMFPIRTRSSSGDYTVLSRGDFVY